MTTAWTAPALVTGSGNATRASTGPLGREVRHRRSGRGGRSGARDDPVREAVARFDLGGGVGGTQPRHRIALVVVHVDHPP